MTREAKPTCIRSWAWSCINKPYEGHQNRAKTTSSPYLGQLRIPAGRCVRLKWTRKGAAEPTVKRSRFDLGSEDDWRHSWGQLRCGGLEFPSPSDPSLSHLCRKSRFRQGNPLFRSRSLIPGIWICGSQRSRCLLFLLVSFFTSHPLPVGASRLKLFVVSKAIFLCLRTHVCFFSGLRGGLCKHAPLGLHWWAAPWNTWRQRECPLCPRVW